jgi:hypothetical protein
MAGQTSWKREEEPAGKPHVIREQARLAWHIAPPPRPDPRATILARGNGTLRPPGGSNFTPQLTGH